MSFLRRLQGWLPIRILDLYITRQLLISTFIAVAVLSVILVLGQVFKVLLELIMKDLLPLEKLPEMVWNMFAFSLSFTVPWGILTATLLVFGRMSADNELTSMRMAGMGLGRICLPVMVVASLLSLLCYWVNVKIAPDAYKIIKAQKYTAALDDPIKLFEPKQVLDSIPGYVMYCEDRDGNHLKNFIAFALSDMVPPEPTTFMMARDVEVTPLKERRMIDMNLSDMLAITHEYKDAIPGDPESRARILEVKAPLLTDKSPMPVDLKRFWERANRPRVDGLSMEELREVYADTGEEVSLRQGPPNQVLKSYLEAMSDRDRMKLRSEALTEYNSRYSFSLACLTLTLVGICFGITAQRRETTAGFVLSLAVGILYFAFITVGALLKDKPQYYPQFWVWFPNILFGAIGIYLFWRHQRK